MPFEPIAIVGRSCLVAGALGPTALWEKIVAGDDLLTDAPEGRWRTSFDRVLAASGTPGTDRAVTRRGGYVTGFDEVFDPGGFAVDRSTLEGLDPVFLWALHTAREALRDAGLDPARAEGQVGRVGAVFGNLSFPSAGMSAFAEHVWLERSATWRDSAAWRAKLPRSEPENRFSSGLPAIVLGRALALTAGSFAIDAACASSLYAVKSACDRLHDRQADVMVAGGVNCADDLFIHMGFSALSALSRSGQSRPFHRGADGLVPSEGAAFVALRRLDDAVREGDAIHGVIRGVGLSNDGRGQGFLVPSSEGQVRAMQAAYRHSGVDPSSVSYLECHATGTVVGDATEIASIVEVFGRDAEIPIGSLKSNLGHLITAAGAAGLIKVIEGLAAGVLPPSRSCDDPIDALGASSLRLVTGPEPWKMPDSVRDGVRRAGISAFGFGGNNAHLIVEEYQAGAAEPQASRVPRTPVSPGADIPVAIVGLGVVAAGACGRQAFAESLASGRPMLSTGPDGIVGGRMDGVTVDAAVAGVPPNDLRDTLPQQLLMLEVARQASAEAGELPRERTGVFVGMGVDAEVARYGARWRAADGLEAGPSEPDDLLTAVRDAFVDDLTSAGVIGTMPNIVTNRLNRLLDVGGPSFSVSSEECSGLDALDVAARALRNGELDVAMVGAVDLSCEPVQAEAAKRCLPVSRHVPGDAAVAVVLRRLDDAVAAGQRIYAVVESSGGTGGAAGGEELEWGPDSGEGSLTDQFGHAHAASGLLHLAAAAVSLDRRLRPSGMPWLAHDQRRARVVVAPMGCPDEARRWSLREALPAERPDPPVGEAPTRFHVLSAGSTRELVQLLDDFEPPGGPRSAVGSGPERLVIVAEDASSFEERRVRARAHLVDGAPPGRGVHHRRAPVEGEVAFVYTSAASAYPGMGRELLTALPELPEAICQRFEDAAAALRWAHEGDRAPKGELRLWGASVLSQVHTELSRGVLGLVPQAAIGYSSGESNSLFAMGVWNDIDDMWAEIHASGMYSHQLAGSFDAVAGMWGGDPEAVAEARSWQTWSVLAPVSDVEALTADEPRCHVSIVHSDSDCVISGSAGACGRVVSTVGAARCRRLPYDFACHVPEVEAFRDDWLRIHRREVAPVEGVRFYSNGRRGAYRPDSETIAQAITSQAVSRLDLRPTIESAWDDGVRVFVEHGPLGSCSGWIREILGERASQAVIVPLDRDGAGLDQVFEAVAQLIAAGVEVDVDRLEARLARSMGPIRFAPPPRPLSMVDLPAHAPPVDLADAVATLEGPDEASSAPGRRVMAPAPRLPSVLDPTPLVGAEAVPAEMSPAHAVPLRSVPAARRPLGTAPAAATTHEPVGNAPADDAAVTHLRALADAHRTFIEQQTRVHALFLGSRGPVRAPIRTEDGGAREVTSHPVASHAAPLLPAPFEAGPPLEAPTSVERQCPEPTRPNATSVAGPAAGSRTPTGPAFSREQLEVHGSGRISELFGPLFEVQDGYERQVRMPEPPLLLADRVTGVDAEPGIAGRGVMWTETDVTSDAWYLNRGRMPAGVLIESGQADLMLISYMGADLRNRGERVYRLLGCELTFEDELPLPGETLKYEIHVDGHAKHGDVRLFFFHYDCLVDGVPRITVRGGQAGFFSDAELAASEGVQWSPEHGERTEDPRLDPPQVLGARRAFDVAQVRAFAEGRLWECFGDEFDLARTHTASPSIQTGDMLFLDEVTDFQPGGGPWGRGYLRAVSAVTPDAWFFQGHFKNDPCMPGTLMFEACLQAQSFLMAALGYTTTRDGWRFEPVQGESIPMVCRGQVTPASHELVYEVFVDEIVAGPEPTLYADVLCSVDGHKAFHARRVGLRLVPDWPLPLTDTSAVDDSTGRPVAVVHDRRGGEFAFGYESLLACALGRPSAAFGPLYEGRDGPVRVPRLPGPPYHFMSRVIEVDGEIGGMQDGSRVVVDYDIDGDEWYFDDNGFETMPHAVLLEAALQPCGWLASYVGAALTTDEELCFRNLDGTGTLHEEVRRGSKVLRTESTLTGISVAAGVIIVNFDVECTVEGRTVYSVKTVFGFFPPESLARQVGQPTTDDERLLALGPSDEVLDLADRPERYFGGAARLASGRLGMLDRITTVRRDGGRDGLGHYRAERDIDPADWYFRAHFFQDPVQPGSLGIEAMIELLQFAMLDQDLDRDLADPRFEPLALGVALTWKYRGQVIPSNEKVTVTVELSSISRSDDGVVATARAALWCDGVKIYSAEDLGMRIVSGEPAGGPGGGPGRVGGTAEPLRPRGLACLVDTGAGGGRSAIDVAAVGEYWSRLLGVPTRWLGGDLMRGLMSRYLRNVVVEDADAFEAVTVGGAIYLANHQVQIESVLMTQVLSAVTATPLVTIANAKHRNGWPGWLESVLCSYPGARDPESIAYFDPADRASMFEILETVKPDLAAGRRALFLHPQGTRSRVAPDPVSRVSSLFLDLAIDAGVPIVPTRFVGGLPEEPLDGKLELPLGHGAQDFHIARPITAAELVSHPYGERRTLVLEALRSVGPIEERPHPGSVEFEAEVDRWAVQTGARQVESAFMRTLAGVDDPSEETLELLGGAAAGVLEHDDDERGRWLAGVARVLYGPSGAAVRAG